MEKTSITIEEKRKQKVSIVIPVFNAEKYVQMALESCLKQTYRNCEIIVVDDGSTDNSARICKEYQESYAQIKYVYQENEGVSSARNKGIEYATGQFIMFVDADDWIESDCVAELMKHMTAGGLSVGQVATADKSEIRQKRITIALSPQQAQLSVLRWNGIQGYPVCKLFDVEIVNELNIRFDRQIAICEDVLFVMEYIKCMHKEAVLNLKKLYHYRDIPQSALHRRFSGIPFEDKWLSEFHAFKMAEQYALSREVQVACKLRAAKAAITILRSMVASKATDRPEYKELLKYARKYATFYLFSPLGAVSSKISILLGTISPFLEYKIWSMTEGKGVL